MQNNSRDHKQTVSDVQLLISYTGHGKKFKQMLNSQTLKSGKTLHSHHDELQFQIPKTFADMCDEEIKLKLDSP